MSSEVFKKLESSLEGDVSSSIVDRVLYSTDASMFQITPQAVCFPKSSNDLITLVQIAGEVGIPITARGAGTSLAGQAVGEGIIIDFSKHINQIIDFDPSAKLVSVEPGLVLGTLNKEMAKHGLTFGPDPASGDRATIGGVLANNATGAHSINYGMAVDHIFSVETILAGGKQQKIGSMPVKLLENNEDAHSQYGLLQNYIYKIRNQHAKLIKEWFPITWRRASGYNLNYLLPWAASKPPNWQGEYPLLNSGEINPAHLFVGSEGTLGLISSATLELVDVPEQKGLAVLVFETIYEACEVVPEILEYSPSAVELIPASLLQLTNSLPHFKKKIPDWVDVSKHLLVVEFFADSVLELNSKISNLDYMQSASVIDLESQNQLWEIRKAGLGILMSRSGDDKPVAFIEDSAVPVEGLSEYVQRVEALLSEASVEGDFYAHASAGCLHIRPIINLKSRRGMDTMQQILKGVEEILVEMGGTVSGEHGDGRIRSSSARNLFGEGIYDLFVELKRILDPGNIFNPGVIIDAQDIKDQLRYSENYQAATWVQGFDFSSQKDLIGAIEMCNGSAVCLNSDEVMCPSYQVTGDEKHSTRARANILRIYISNGKLSQDVSLDMVKEVFDLCLECKACKAECPSSVDIAKLKYEFLNHYYSKHRRPLRDYFFANFELLIQIGGLFPGVTNWIINSWLAKKAFEFLGITTERKFPEIQNKKNILRINQSWLKEKVILISDVYAQTINPAIERIAIEVVVKSGYEVKILRKPGTGRSMISKGFLDKARRRTSEILDELGQIDPNGEVPVICLEPSETMTLLDEMVDLHPDSEYAKALVDRTWNIDEFLIRSVRFREQSGELVGDRGILHLHGHCYQKSRPPHPDGEPVGVEATEEFLGLLGYKVETIDAGCCGMAGAFGYEAEHYEISQKVGELKLFPYLREHGQDRKAVAAGFSCREQIQHGVNQKALHPILFAAHLIED